MILACFNLFVLFVIHTVADFDQVSPSCCGTSGLHDDPALAREGIIYVDQLGESVSSCLHAGRLFSSAPYNLFHVFHFFPCRPRPTRFSLPTYLFR